MSVTKLRKNYILQTCNYGIEYSGVQNTGERVMGLSLIDSNDPISKPDPILKWKVPKDWTLEEAATVPFNYVQAYHILDAPVIGGKNLVHSVLINIGDEGLFSEACIAISLSRNYTVYVSVANAEEAVVIKNKFPQRIENADECMNCLCSFGFFIQIGTPNNIDNRELGLYPFLKALAFVIIPNKISKLLSTLSDDEKENLRAVVENGIRSGLVKPFDRTIQIQGMPANAENNDEFARTNHLKNIFKSFPNNEMCHVMNQKIRYDNNHSYIIVGGEKKNSSWFELVEWLISKGARKFIASVDNFFLGSNISHRMNRLLNQKKATIILTTSQKTETLEDAENLVHEAIRIAPLEAIFFVSVVSH
ncbi:fatty-acid synthase system [Sarracenia purpurea var. burkii]